MIEVKKENENQFKVNLKEGFVSKEYSVTVDDDYYENLTCRNISKEELIRNSIKFLLERESKDSILSSFDLKDIPNYFPEYEKVIQEKSVK